MHSVQPRCQPDLRQVQHHHYAGIRGKDAREQQKIRPVELGRAVQNFAEREWTEIAFHAEFL